MKKIKRNYTNINSRVYCQEMLKANNLDLIVKVTSQAYEIYAEEIGLFDKNEELVLKLGRGRNAEYNLETYIFNQQTLEEKITEGQKKRLLSDYQRLASTDEILEIEIRENDIYIFSSDELSILRIYARSNAKNKKTNFSANLEKFYFVKYAG